MPQRLGSPIAGVAPFEGAQHFDGPKLRMQDRVSQMALFAAAQAIDDAHCDWPHGSLWSMASAAPA